MLSYVVTGPETPDISTLITVMSNSIVYHTREGGPLKTFSSQHRDVVRV